MKHVLVILCALLSSIGISAQTIAVTGVVTDGNQEPLIGASVKEKGTSNGTMTTSKEGSRST